jgi:uncharacterized protein YeaO (DUF488 family)
MADQKFQIKRIYEEPSDDGGYRVLVDRLWPRGVSKEDARLDDWMKSIAPSPDLRKWFDHDQDKLDAFKEKYTSELSEKQEPISTLLDKAADQTVTLLYAAKDETNNHAIILKEFLENTETND